MQIPEELDILPRPGLRDIKAVKLYYKWRPLILEWAGKSTCPKLSDNIIGVVNAKKNEKTNERTKRMRDFASINQGNVETEIVPKNVTAIEDAKVEEGEA